MISSKRRYRSCVQQLQWQARAASRGVAQGCPRTSRGCGSWTTAGSMRWSKHSFMGHLGELCSRQPPRVPSPASSPCAAPRRPPGPAGSSRGCAGPLSSAAAAGWPAPGSTGGRASAASSPPATWTAAAAAAPRAPSAGTATPAAAAAIWCATRRPSGATCRACSEPERLPVTIPNGVTDVEFEAGGADRRPPPLAAHDVPPRFRRGRPSNGPGRRSRPTRTWIAVHVATPREPTTTTRRPTRCRGTIGVRAVAGRRTLHGGSGRRPPATPRDRPLRHRPPRTFDPAATAPPHRPRALLSPDRGLPRPVDSDATAQGQSPGRAWSRENHLR